MQKKNSLIEIGFFLPMEKFDPKVQNEAWLRLKLLKGQLLNMIFCSAEFVIELPDMVLTGNQITTGEPTWGTGNEIDANFKEALRRYAENRNICVHIATSWQHIPRAWLCFLLYRPSESWTVKFHRTKGHPFGYKNSLMEIPKILLELWLFQKKKLGKELAGN